MNKGQLPKYYVEDNHPAIIQRNVFEAIQSEIAKRAEKNKPNNRGNNYPFSKMIRCENCGAHYRRKVSHPGNKYRRVFWNCVTYLKDGKDACHAKQIPEEELYRLSCEVLEMKSFDNDIFKDNIREITIPEWNKVTFVFFNGTAITKDWQDKSRKWTDEMKAENYEALRRNRK